MIYSILRLILVAFLFSSRVVSVNAQSNDAGSSRAGAEKEDLPKGIKESLAKSRIDREKKEYEELLRRGEEAAKLSEELGNSFAQNKTLTVDDQKKLERLEKRNATKMRRKIL